MKGKLRITTFKKGTNELLRQTEFFPNLIVLNDGNGLNLFIKQLLNGGNSMEITQAKIGTGNTPPSSNDTDLEAPVVSGIMVAAKQETAIDEATFEFFISDAELPEGTYREFGIFCGDALFARSLIVPEYTKSINEDTKIDYIITVENLES